MLMVEELVKSKYLPSSSTMQKARIRVDTCYMRWRAQQWRTFLEEGGGHVLPHLDASPHAGQNYETIGVRIIKQQGAAELHHLSDVLDQMSFDLFKIDK